MSVSIEVVIRKKISSRKAMSAVELELISGTLRPNLLFLYIVTPPPPIYLNLRAMPNPTINATASPINT